MGKYHQNIIVISRKIAAMSKTPLFGYNNGIPSTFMDQTNTPTPPDEILMLWQAPIMPNHARSQRWYLIAGILALTLIAYAILTGAWTFAIVVLLSSGMYFLLRDHKHPKETIAITSSGVQVRSRFLRWQDIGGYWLVYAADYTELHFTPKDPKARDLKIQTGDQSIADLKTVLNGFVPELTDKHESLIDFFIRICKL